MMGMQSEPAQLFYEFCLDDHVPTDHLLRRIDRFLDLESVRSELRSFYSTIGAEQTFAKWLLPAHSGSPNLQDSVPSISAISRKHRPKGFSADARGE